MRREFLKGYLLALLAEGQLQGARTPVDVAKAAARALAEDVPAVVGEILTLAAQHGAGKLGDAILRKMDGAARDIMQRGFGAAWRDIMDQYRRGVEAKHGPRKS
jgi:hypothetical protein